MPDADLRGREGDKLLFLFDCGDLAEDEGRIRLAADELDRWEWVRLDQPDDYLSPALPAASTPRPP
jgi:hypothetical protein